MKVKELFTRIIPHVLISLVILLTVGAYILNFHNLPISQETGNWGTFGDYIGGILNPLISFTALLYLIKAYRSQKQELEETKDVLKKTEIHNSSISKTQISQTEIMKDSQAAQLISLRIDVLYKSVSYLQGELNRAAAQINSNSNSIHGVHNFLVVPGECKGNYDRLDTNRTREYAAEIAQKIQNKLGEIKSLEKILNGEI
ncbi:hypothetical protein NRZ32_04405 [Aeromonas dhakensis]|uniref:hypothetical protein n=1 Tax=Aeromonas dhakensis TaxID=196024 RepID=UPI00227A6933|nr:hypothetical protein [Aeromonas dhakensis]WAG12386.1 hypothetical protein NRZ32_04405 [Aeromonas dhakensis]